MKRQPRKGQNDYISLFYDLDKFRLIFGTRGKDNQTVEAFAADLKAHGGDPLKITDAAIDMSGAFIKGSQGTACLTPISPLISSMWSKA